MPDVLLQTVKGISLVRIRIIMLQFYNFQQWQGGMLRRVVP